MNMQIPPFSYYLFVLLLFFIEGYELEACFCQLAEHSDLVSSVAFLFQSLKGLVLTLQVLEKLTALRSVLVIPGPLSQRFSAVCG